MNRISRSDTPAAALALAVLAVPGWPRMEAGLPASVNLYAGWIGILMGCAAGAVQGLWFHHENWLGGYASWPRRMLRLGHISFFGIGILNLAFALSVGALGIETPAWSAGLLLAGAAGMPLVCYLSALRKGFRRLFFIPALSVIAGTGVLVWRLVSK